MRPYATADLSCGIQAALFPNRLGFGRLALAPTLLRLEGLRFVTYPNDHEPAHVHVVGPGWVVVVNLLEPEVRESIGCREADARRVLRLVVLHRAALLEGWRRWHG